MLRKLQFLAVVMLFSVSSALAQGDMGTLKGKVTDKKTGEELPFVNLILELNGVQKYGAATDFDGEFTIKPVVPSKYDLKVSFVGYQPMMIKGIVITNGKITFQDLKLNPTDVQLEAVDIVEYSVPLIDKDGGASGGTVSREDIAKMPGRSASSLATTVGGVASDANGNISSIRGARSDANYFYIDGIKVRGSSSLPKSAIEQVTVVTGGVPANFGDATGGIISITTRGPSSKYFGGIEYLTSGWKFGDKVYGLDQYGFNLIEGSLSGPLAFRKDSLGEKTTPILGFFLSGNYTSQVDPFPSAIGSYTVRDDVKERLIANPLRPTGTGQGVFYQTDFLREDSLQLNKWRPNVAQQNATIAGKVDVNTGSNMNLSFGGSLSYGNGSLYDYNGSVLNFENYGENTNYDWRVYGKFTQRFANAEQEEGQESSSGVKNAYYTVMVDYSKNFSRSQDANHRDNLFGYGYIGEYITHREKSFEFVQNPNGTVSFEQAGTYGMRDTLITFTASDINREMASITSQYFNTYDDPEGNYENLVQVQDGNGLRNGDLPQSVYSMWTNIGTNYNNYSLFDGNQFRITASGSADIGDHAISLGFEFEQRTDRAFSVAPIGLWGLMRQESNFHLQELDESTAHTYNVGTTFFTEYDRLVGEGIFTFSYNLREKLGLDPNGTDLVDVDALDPSLFTLDLFSADELLNQGASYVSYYGYDHTGKKLAGNPSFDDFFNEQNDRGDFTRPIAAFQPIYIAGYVMDKFAFDDIIFNVGVRVDRFDANQSVLKDKYLLYEAKTKGEMGANEFGAPLVQPGNVPNDAIVYVNDINDPTAINGYRSGDTWYNADGVEVTDPSVLRAPSGIAPYLLDPSQETPSSSAFKDYEPQVIIMPRVAFSFPISDEALFFAHYDILSKRPTTGNRLDPIDYLFLETGNTGIINNPDLKPEKTIDYELGFQQVLSRSSSLKISAFYRELRDMVQLVNVGEAYPRSYRTFGNIDFGTIKGMTVSYDLRRTGNIWMRAAYTLQFAEGTGSSATTQLSLVNSGQPNLRTISPFSYDQRHQITATMDYRYGDGDDYNGPVWFGKKFFENTGANFQMNAASGQPYSAQRNITAEGVGGAGSSALAGQINGSRLPWTFRVDTQIDRNLVLKFGKDDDNKKTANLNVYLLVNNLFNTLNIVNVYRATGNPDDDGYLAAAEFQASIEQQNDEQSFRELYALKVNNPYNYSLPRTIRLGVKLDF